MSNETDLDEFSLLNHGYERFLSDTGDLSACDNAIITVRHQKHITTHFGPLTSKNKIKLSLSQEQILNQSNRFRPSNITRSQSINFQKSSYVPSFGGPLFNRDFQLNRRPSIRPSLIPIKIRTDRNQSVNLQRSITLGSNVDELNQQKDFVPKYRSVRKLSGEPFEHQNYVLQDDESTLSSLPIMMTKSIEPPLINTDISTNSNEHSSDLLSRFKCGICLNILSDCRVLDCLHTFCLECLYSIEQTSPNRMASVKRSVSLKSNASKIDNFNSRNTHCTLDDSSKENERKVSKSSRTIGNNPIDRDTIASALKKCAPDQQKKSSSTLQPKRPLSAITEKYKVTLRCPICGQRTIIPIGGVSRVPKNFLLERQLSDAVEKLQVQQLPISGCSQCYDQNVANVFCVNCEINLCTICLDAHLRQRWTSKHNIISLQCNNVKNKIANIESDQHVISNGNLKCFIHPTQDLQLYCSNCDQVACHNCTILLHKGHKFETIDNAKQYVIENLRESVENSKKFQLNIRNSICELTESIAKINAEADSVQNEMVMFIKDYFKALEAHKEALLDQITKAKAVQTLSIKEQQEYLIKRANELKHANHFAQNLLENGNDIEILTFIGILQNRFDFCQKSKNVQQIDSQHVNKLQFLRDVRAPTTPHQNNIPIYGIVSRQTTSIGLLDNKQT